ncbi:hypothetical protein Pmar_PMAR023820 [Perkinsus marinus ATCC 50983]|uniref:Uncharacterized protein n=1 Tax=Perkinsus marinus (strain ATCC 50983 / TXsc) TaxID=423536 RepID=C5KYL0_PERM5|nr:hypothetical protein Pmar_PMAR023819 [Perkinsus marinus ATCC 50983]XP_002778651.1 hypothetical protein Pmar_PMAR023820 [Perkinsus marinus ATCC 50983]EER10445.1 hypothetical protein Pmar_PMAR023819 [Perkinsus marinus ATCC 50983]EER10446.1 hypothetical protein Pmar_PMAR023820 [Perkinsus marinus ATCC 50983]|eukprot:XP_002778650.1 hypothetical protein Pmar_PMAR023819 [Perkinsus marinus ATCC 50983]
MFVHESIQAWADRWAILDGLEKAVSTGFFMVVIGVFVLMLRFRGNTLKRAEEFFVVVGDGEGSECSTYVDSTAESVSDIDF